MGSVDLKIIGSDLPRPNLAEEDSYSGGGVKKSATGPSTTTRSRQRSSSSPATMEVAAALGFESSSEGVRSSRVKIV